MKLKFVFLLLLFPIWAFPQDKMMAITIDDLPFVRPGNFPAKEVYRKTESILKALKRHHAPAIGFVNLFKVYESGEVDSSRYGLLQLWVKQGFDLGNHTFSHPDYNKVNFHDFTNDIEKNEPLLKALLKEYRKPLIYFRFPFLHRGNSKPKVDSITQYLAFKRYTEAPVTIDNSEWIFAAAYDSCLRTHNRSLCKEVGNEYLKYMESKVKYYEGQSVKLFGHNIRQVLLIHANSLNADYLDTLLEMFSKKIGYAFISLAAALRDEAYQAEDHYYKSGGISWMDRWALTQGKNRNFFMGEPFTPPFIMKLAKVDSE